MSATTYDYIVCGGGTAGCLLANRLSADPTKHVLLIEAGGNDDYLWVHIPVGYLYCIGNPRTDWLFSTDADPGLNGRRLRYPRGKVLGGCSSINGMIYMRGQARDYDGWGAGDGFGANPGWSWDECLPHFLKHEDFYNGADAFHAAPGFDPQGERPGGEWRVERQRLRWDVLDAFAEAAQQAGIPPTEDFNRGDNEGVGYFHVNQKAGIRWNATKAFLHLRLVRAPDDEGLKGHRAGGAGVLVNWHGPSGSQGGPGGFANQRRAAFGGPGARERGGTVPASSGGKVAASKCKEALTVSREPECSADVGRIRGRGARNTATECLSVRGRIHPGRCVSQARSAFLPSTAFPARHRGTPRHPADRRDQRLLDAQVPGIAQHHEAVVPDVLQLDRVMLVARDRTRGSSGGALDRRRDSGIHKATELHRDERGAVG